MFSNSKIVALRCPNLEHLVEKFGKSIVLLKNAFQFQNINTMLPTKMCAKKEVSKSKRNWVKRSFSASISFVKHFCTCYKVQTIKFSLFLPFHMVWRILCYFVAIFHCQQKNKQDLEQKFFENVLCENKTGFYGKIYKILWSNVKQNWFSYSQERNLIAMHTFLSAWTIPRSALYCCLNLWPGSPIYKNSLNAKTDLHTHLQGT